jgi:hypothetical protein
VAENFIAVADCVARQVEEFSCPNARAAHQAMSRTVRNKGEIAGAQQARLDAVHFQQALPGRDDVKHQALVERWQFQGPWSGELGPAIKSAAHAQKVERFAEWIVGCG